MAKKGAFLSFILAFFFLTVNGFAQTQTGDLTDEIMLKKVIRYGLGNRQLKYEDLMLFSDQDANAGRIIPLNAASNKVAYPPRISEFNQNVIDKARELYNRGDYDNSAKTYNSVFDQEKQNIFYIYELGLAYYWLPDYRKYSHEYLSVIAEELSNKYKDGETKTTIDFSYHELYWKLGTLQLDYADNPGAVMNLSKAMIVLYTLGENRNGNLDELNLGYLAEAFSLTGNREAFDYFRRFIRNKYPKNTYTDKFKK